MALFRLGGAVRQCRCHGRPLARRDHVQRAAQRLDAFLHPGQAEALL